MLTRKGVTAWRHALSDLTDRTAAPAPTRPAPASASASGLPAVLAAQLVDALAAAALAGLTTTSPVFP